MQKIIISLLILASLFVFLVLPNSLNICVPYSYSFTSNVCDNNTFKTFSENKKLVVAKFYAQQKLFNLSTAKLFDHLAIAFSDGILNPKIY